MFLGVLEEGGGATGDRKDGEKNKWVHGTEERHAATVDTGAEKKGSNQRGVRNYKIINFASKRSRAPRNNTQIVREAKREVKRTHL